ncbi:hypothetical protein, partial [Streptomyces sp. KR55]|uniref:hypothetical protein n=1 Tax=Streptomyces sp. KR55 TaxID=3457425 RepID=UPI003FD68102
MRTDRVRATTGRRHTPAQSSAHAEVTAVQLPSRRGGSCAGPPRDLPGRAQTPAPSNELICCGSPQTISRAPAWPRA